MFDIHHNVSILPNSPGIYMMKDENSKIIYVGKAKDLKKRVSQYFQRSRNHSEKTKRLVKNIKEFEYIVTQNEIEALILENNFIKKHKPRYNILLKDDKTYPFIKITTKEDFPRIFMTKRYVKDGNLYFGPFAATGVIGEIINLFKSIFLVRSCRIAIKEGSIACRPCMYYQIKKCNAPCYGLVTKEEYSNIIKQVIEILSGKNKSEFIKYLEKEMETYSENLEYEKALVLREKIKSLDLIFQKQKIFLGNCETEDYINIFSDGKDACIQIFFLRDGKIVARDYFIFENIENESEESIVEQFIKRFYGSSSKIPDIIYSPEFLDKDSIEEWLAQVSKKRVQFKTPKIGDKRKLFDLVFRNAKITLEKFKFKGLSKLEDKSREYLSDLCSILNIDFDLNRIEAYDISNISGVDSVGSMIVFSDGIPNKSDYRKFRIKNIEGSNDYESIRQVIFRRFTHGIDEIEKLKDGSLAYENARFCDFPDLILIDGGRGHINAVKDILHKFNMHIPVCGMVKDNRHRTRGIIYKNEEIKIDLNSDLMKFITRVQDEVHRYAIMYHRNLRNKSGFSSVLDEIPKIGGKRKKDLLVHFKSIEAIKKASIDELLEVTSMNREAGMSIIEFFKNNK